MTLRAGSYDRSVPDWKGIIRDDGWPVYECYHRDHDGNVSARECARKALAYIREHDKLPDGWTWTDQHRKAVEERKENQ